MHPCLHQLGTADLGRWGPGGSAQCSHRVLSLQGFHTQKTKLCEPHVLTTSANSIVALKFPLKLERFYSISLILYVRKWEPGNVAQGHIATKEVPGLGSESVCQTPTSVLFVYFPQARAQPALPRLLWPCQENISSVLNGSTRENQPREKVSASLPSRNRKSTAVPHRLPLPNSGPREASVPP